MHLYYREQLYIPLELWRLRTAADIPVTPKDRVVKKDTPEYDNIVANFKPLTDKLLAQYGIKPTADLALTQEGDGVDILYNISAVFNTLTYIRFDINTKKKSVQEIQVRLMCKPPHSFVANNANDIKELMVALQIAQKAQKRAGTLTKLDADATDNERDEYTEVILLYVINSGKSKAIDITDLTAVNEALDDLGLDSSEVSNAREVLSRWNAQDFANFATLMKGEAGSVVGTTQLIYQAINDLTKHEEFVISDATVHVQAYKASGTVLIGLETPWPTFVELQKSGQKMALKNFAVQTCNVIMNSGPNVQLAQALLTMQVNLILASKRAANPALSKTPEDKYAWTPEQIDEFLNTGLGLYFHERPMENNPMGQFDVWCIMVANEAVECYEKGEERQIQRNQAQSDDRFVAYLNSEKPDYFYHYYPETRVMKLYKPGSKAVLKEFKDVDHTFANTQAKIETERRDGNASPEQIRQQPHHDWYDQSQQSKAQRAAQP